MKPLLQPSLLACVFLASAWLWPVPASLCHAAEAEAKAEPAPDYKVMINALFDQAATCKITGGQQLIKRHWFEFTTPDAQSLQKLREVFLREQPRYLGTDIPASIDLDNPFGLRFILLDKEGQRFGCLDLQDKDKLIFNKTHLFTTSTTATQNVALLTSAADFACPELAAERKLPKPDWKTAVERLFAGAATCKITGEFSYKDDPSHDVNFSTSDPATLRELKAMFLSETPRFVVSGEGLAESGLCARNLYFHTLDALGKDVGKVSLFCSDVLYFRPSHDIYNTTPVGDSGGNITLMNLLGRFSQPEFYPRPKLPPAAATDKVEAGKKAR